MYLWASDTIPQSVLTYIEPYFSCNAMLEARRARILLFFLCSVLLVLVAWGAQDTLLNNTRANGTHISIGNTTQGICKHCKSTGRVCGRSAKWETIWLWKIMISREFILSLLLFLKVSKMILYTIQRYKDMYISILYLNITVTCNFSKFLKNFIER